MSNISSEVFSLMQTGTPYKSYKKTILSKIYVNVLNSFSGQPEGRIVSGNPRTELENCIIDMWSEMEDVYFKRTNKKHFETGNLIEYKRKEQSEKVKTIKDYSDEELTVLLNSRFLTLQSVISKVDSVAPLFRLLTLAKEMEKSEKIIKFLEGKLSELQLAEFKQSEDIS